MSAHVIIVQRGVAILVLIPKIVTLCNDSNHSISYTMFFCIFSLGHACMGCVLLEKV